VRYFGCASGTLDVQAVPVQTMLLLSCADCTDFKNKSHVTGYSRQGRYSLIPSVTEGQHEYLFSNLGTEDGTLEDIQSASLNH